MRDELNSAMITHGELFVMMAGMIMMHRWYADNLERAFLMLVSNTSIHAH